MTDGIEFEFEVARLGTVELREGSVRVTPVIEAGEVVLDEGPLRARYKAPDMFDHFEIELRMPARSFLRFRRMAMFEMWTSSDEGYVRWCFPHVVWKARFWNRFLGVTYEGEPFVPEGIPGGTPITHGGYWKVVDVP